MAVRNSTTFESANKIGLVFFLALLFIASSLTSKANANEKSSHLEINMVSYEIPPYVIEQGRELDGLAVRYVKNLMKRAGVPFRLSVMPPKRALIYTLATPSTCVFPIERSQEREVQFSWVSPITISRHGLYAHPARPTHPIRVLNDLEDLRVGSFAGSAIGDYLISLNFNVDLAAENKANITKLASNRIDLWASDTLSARYIAKKQGFKLGEPELVFFTTLGAIGCNRGVPQIVIGRLSSTLQAMYRDGTIRKLTEEFELD